MSELRLPLLTDITVLRRKPKIWIVQGTFEDGRTATLASMGDGEADWRSEDLLQASAAAAASALWLLHRRLMVEQLGIAGRVAHASIAFESDTGATAPSYGGVSLRIGKRVERFRTGDPVADWATMKIRARQVAEILMHTPSCEDFIIMVPGYTLDSADMLIALETSGSTAGPDGMDGLDRANGAAGVDEPQPSTPDQT